jgi:hypothetical protein
MGWEPRTTVEVVVSEHELTRYKAKDPSGPYHAFRWPRSKQRGIHSDGEFPVAVARQRYFDLGCEARISGRANEDGVKSFQVVWELKEDPKKDEGYRHMVDVFTEPLMIRLRDLAKVARKKAGLRRPGGEPDLFVECPNGGHFFVEVKRHGPGRYRDEANTQQHVLFPLIEGELGCEVKLFRVKIVRE